jgi:tetratricopeptide (TPR) repeat protein
MDKDNLTAFASGAPRMTDDLPWAEFLAPKLIYERNVADLLAALDPYVEPINPLVTFPKGERGRELREAVVRRHRAHVQDLEGLKVYYGSGPLAAPEEQFRVSLEIDPKDANAQYYIVEVLLARGRMFTAWEELDKAIPLLEEARKWAPKRLDVELALGDAYSAAGRPEDAERAYRSYLELGGSEPRALDAAGDVPPGR